MPPTSIVIEVRASSAKPTKTIAGKICRAELRQLEVKRAWAGQAT